MQSRYRTILKDSLSLSLSHVYIHTYAGMQHSPLTPTSANCYYGGGNAVALSLRKRNYPKIARSHAMRRFSV